MKIRTACWQAHLSSSAGAMAMATGVIPVGLCLPGYRVLSDVVPAAAAARAV